MIRALFFDLDDTLICYDAAYDIALAASHALLSEQYPRISRSALSKAIMDAYENRFGYGTEGFADLGILSVSELRQILTGLALESLQVPAQPEFLSRVIEAHEQVEEQHIQPFTDTVRTLEILSEYFPLGIITNGPSSMQRAKLERLGLLKHFKYVVVDTEFGHSKPDVRIFRFAEAVVGLKPEEMLFVGNSLEADVAGSVGAGWTSVWVNATQMPLPEGVPAPHFTVQNIGEVCSLFPIVQAMKCDKGNTV